jgi:hypothetical protein
MALLVPAKSDIVKIYRWYNYQRHFFRDLPNSDIPHYDHHFRGWERPCGFCIRQPGLSCLWVSA